jgi:hypothetical protein
MLVESLTEEAYRAPPVVAGEASFSYQAFAMLLGGYPEL